MLLIKFCGLAFEVVGHGQDIIGLEDFAYCQGERVVCNFKGTCYD